MMGVIAIPDNTPSFVPDRMAAPKRSPLDDREVFIK
tara:strand:+ start:511 stop:618 length:108 start_codon:yes stop_codon:yes gene_type:complete